MSLPALSAFACRLGETIRAGGHELRDEAAFDRAARALFRLQFAANAACRRWALHRGITPDTVTRWSDIPAIPVAAFKELELTSLPPAARTRVFHTSGTSGHRPGRHFHAPESLALYEESLAAWFVPHLIPPGGPVCLLSLTPPPEDAPHSSLVHMLATVLRRHGGAGSAFLGTAGPEGWTVAPGTLQAALAAAVRSRRPVLLAGTAFNFVHALDALADAGFSFRLPPGSCVLETGGYKGRSRELTRAELHAAITAAFGVPDAAIIREYGMSELSSQAYDRIAGRGGPRAFRFPPWARAEVMDPETGAVAAPGQTGRLRVLDLANVWSVAAIQTEDLAVQGEDGFELAGRAPAAELRGCSLLAA